MSRQDWSITNPEPGYDDWIARGMPTGGGNAWNPASWISGSPVSDLFNNRFGISPGAAEEISKGGKIASAAIATYVGASYLQAGYGALAGEGFSIGSYSTGAALSTPEIIAPIYGDAAMTGLELEAAAGSGVFWAEPGIVAGSSSGLFSSAGGGGILSSLKAGADALGLTGVFSGLIGKGKDKIESFINKEVSSFFDGEKTNNFTSSDSISSGSGMAFLPYILIGLTLIGAFILTRKRRIAK